MFQRSFSRSSSKIWLNAPLLPRCSSQSLTQTILFLLFLFFKHFEAAASNNIELETQQIVAFVRIFHQKKQIVARSNMYESHFRLCSSVLLQDKNMLGVYNGVILQADVSESADMSRTHRVAMYTRRFASRFPGPTNRHEKSQRVNTPCS